MSDLDQFERELTAMRPREPSAELKRRISLRLAEGSEPATTARRRVVHVRGSIVGGFLAASLAAFALWIAHSDNRDEQTSADATRVQPILAFDESLPSVWSYRLASKQSGDALEDLFDRYGEKSSAGQSEEDRIAAFKPFNRGARLLGTEL